jgi:AraC-like DNA-binding protein
MQHPAIGMEDLEVCIVWNRCRRRRWPEGRELVFTPEETRKRRNVLLHCWAGSGWRDGPGGRMKVEPGSCFWSRPGWSYRAGQTPDDPLGITAIHFDLMDRAGGWVEPARVVVPSERLTCRHPALVEATTRWIAELAMATREAAGPEPETREGANRILHGLLLLLLRETELSRRGVEHRIAWPELTAFVHEHLHERPSVEALARHAHMTRSHFSRVFKERLGVSPQEYIIGARIDLAKQLLRETDLPVGEVGLHAGYQDPFRFAKQFRQRTGHSPSQYRNALAAPTGNGLAEEPRRHIT